MNTLCMTSEWRMSATRAAVVGTAWARHTERPNLTPFFQQLTMALDPGRARRRRFTIVGLFSAGKTTLLNGYLDLPEAERLPVGLSETTAIPTLVRPSDQSRLMVWLDGRLVEASPELRQQFASLKKDAVPPLLGMFLKGHSEVVFETLLDDPTRLHEFLDTPGLSGASPGLDRSMSASLLASNGVMYVVNGKDGTLNHPQQKFLRDAVLAAGIPVHVSVTHLDEVAPNERGAILEEIRKQASSLGIHRELVAAIDSGTFNMSWMSSFANFLARTPDSSDVPILRVLDHTIRALASELMRLPDDCASRFAGIEILDECLGLADAAHGGVPSVRCLPFSHHPRKIPEVVQFEATSGGFLVKSENEGDDAEEVSLCPDGFVLRAGMADFFDRRRRNVDAPWASGNFATRGSFQSPSGKRALAWNLTAFRCKDGKEIRHNDRTDQGNIRFCRISDLGDVLVMNSDGAWFYPSKASGSGSNGGPIKLRCTKHFEDLDFLPMSDEWIAFGSGWLYAPTRWDLWVGKGIEMKEELGPFLATPQVWIVDGPARHWLALTSVEEGSCLMIDGKTVLGPCTQLSEPAIAPDGLTWAIGVKQDDRWFIQTSLKERAWESFDLVSMPLVDEAGRFHFAALSNGIVMLRSI